MPVITISRQLGSLGDEIAQLLSEDFKSGHLDKESLEGLFAEYGISKESVERYDEKKPGFWDLFKTDRARYLHFMKEAVFKFARKENCVILGRGGQVLFKDLPGILRVRIIAPLEIRKQNVMKTFTCNESHAEKIIQHSDNERAGFHKFFFDENWENLELYDLVINTGSFSTGAVELIKNIVQTDEFKTAQKETGQKLADLCLEHQIKTNIIYKEKILLQFLEVTADRGIVTLRGIVDSNADLEQCEKIVAEMPEVKEVHNEIYFSPISSAYALHY